MKKFATLALLFLCSAIIAFGQEKLGIVSGKVTDKLSGQPIANATVSAGDKEAKTDSEGNYRLEISAGEYNLRFRASGFHRVAAANR